MRGGSIHDPLLFFLERRVSNRGAPIRTPCRPTAKGKYATCKHSQILFHVQLCRIFMMYQRGAGEGEGGEKETTTSRGNLLIY